MTKLAPDLFQKRFQDLVEIGRARLPSLAPEWTDHNAHDPGITLMELLAWTTEAQLYSLSRVRRDEREAYAALIGIAPRGTRPARGLIWPDRLDPNSPFATFNKSVVIPESAVIEMPNADNPKFMPLRTLLWAPGRIEKLETRTTSGTRVDHTATNERGGLPYLPFGENAGRSEALAMTFECRDTSGLFGSNRKIAQGALWPIGVMVPKQPGTIEAPISDPPLWSPLVATLVSEDARYELKIALDTTQGLLTTGVLLLDLDSVQNNPSRFTIELRSPNGLPLPPSVQRIEPNVIPVLQARTIAGELHISNGQPDWNFLLEVPGLSFASDENPIAIEITDIFGTRTWDRCDRLSDVGPKDFRYELDAQSGKVSFGNGVNGCIPAAESQVFVTYTVSDGEEGQVARNRKWKVAGFAGTFGVNPDAIAGGSAPSRSFEDRRDARKRSREDHALVCSSDIIAAAKALPLLKVARAWVAPLDIHMPRTGTVTLVAMRHRERALGVVQTSETAHWLETIRRKLAPRLPLGSRLVVTAPRYVGFRINAILEARQGNDPAVIKKAVEDSLSKRLALFDTPGVLARRPGQSLTIRDVSAWIRAIDGVNRVLQLQLLDDKDKSVSVISIPRSGLPSWDIDRSSLEVKRPDLGRLR